MRTTNPIPPAPGTSGHAESLWLAGGHVVDVIAGRVLREMNIEIADGIIRRVTADAPPAGARVVDVAGGYVSPGLVTVHTHFTIVYPFTESEPEESAGTSALRGAARARDALNAGVTTVRTVDEHNQADLLIRRAVEDGWLQAPRIYASGRAIGITGGHGKGGGCVYADGYDEFLKAARAELAAGADHIKIFISGGIAHLGEVVHGAQMTADEIRAVVRATEEQGTYVVAHAGSAPAIREAVALGVRSFEHGYDLDAQTVAMLAEAHAYLTPTLSVTSCPDWMRAHRFTEWQIDLAMDVHPRHLASAQLAFGSAVTADLADDAPGIRIVAGTDYLPGEPNDGTSCAVKEMELLEQAGLPVAVALRAGTWEAARLVGGTDTFGSIAEGLAADVLVVHEDPTESVSALRTIHTVVQGGRFVRTTLDTAEALR